MRVQRIELCHQRWKRRMQPLHHTRVFKVYEGTRTLGLLLGKQTLYQLRYIHR
jgi:hypothetical protein